MTIPFFLETYLREVQCEPNLIQLISYIARAAKYVQHAIRHEHLGISGTVNVQGEEQLKLDILSDNIFCKHLAESNLVAQISSEEQEDAVVLMDNLGEYSVAFDPLDGSSLVASNLAVGSIFGIFPGNGFIGMTGRQMVAAGYMLYGPRTTLSISIGKGLASFMLNDLGEFQSFSEGIRVEETAKIFAPGNLRAVTDRPSYQKLVTKWSDEKFTLRYSGGMVPDINTIFCKGNGIFAYPSSEKYPKGKLRLLYECAPFAFLMEQAGGLAKTETGEDILDLPIQDLHERTSILVGSKKTVEDAINMLK
ncbi:fructose-1,6-bisphosphatase [Candidatus Peregrinibacteria bacterium]|nr:fructose-1,6-bisphosphatase [Candidatus Peregrinibacteria bacterium]